MLTSRVLTSMLLCCAVPFASLAAEWQGGYSVTYSGGSLSDVRSGEGLKIFIDSGSVRLTHRAREVARIPARAITEVNYGREVHHRIGTGVALAVVSLGIGVMVAFSKSKKHYIGVNWADGGNTGGVVLQADKNEYRGVIAALEGVSGRTAIDTDSPHSSARQQQVAPRVREEAPAPVAAVRESEAPKTIVIRFTSTPANAEVQIDGEYWGSTPTADVTRMPAGSHTIVVKKLNYERWERKITLAPGDDRTIGAELQPNDASKPHIAGLN
jgi:PEGA domain